MAERLAHTLKGVAGNIGIVDVQEAAAKVEKAIREGAPPAQEYISDLKAVLEPRVAVIRKVVNSVPARPEPARAFDREKAVSAIAKLVSLLEANDGDAADAVQEVAAALAGKVDVVRLEALRNSIDEFDFDGARTKLVQIADENHLGTGPSDDQQRREEAHSAG